MSQDEIHGGGEWGFTKCLWAPAYKRGSIKSSWLYWENILKVNKGDTILHLRGKGHAAAFVGYSIAATDGHETLERPPQAGKWNYATNYFRTLLKDYHTFGTPIFLETFFFEHTAELRKYLHELTEAPINRFFVFQNNKLQCLNGAYLSQCDEKLLSFILGEGIKQASSPKTTVVYTSEILRRIKQLIGQENFSAAVKKNYKFKCCFPDCKINDPNFLIGSHIARWVDNSDKRGNISNGLCFCVLHDTAFEAGYFSLDDEYCVILNPKLEIQMSETFIEHIKPFEHREIDCAEIRPDKYSLKEHRFRCKIAD